MKALRPVLLFIVLSAIGLIVVWQAADLLQAGTIPVALLWLVLVSKIVAITLAVRDSRASD